MNRFFVRLAAVLAIVYTVILPSGAIALILSLGRNYSYNNMLMYAMPSNDSLVLFYLNTWPIPVFCFIHVYPALIAIFVAPGLAHILKGTQLRPAILYMVSLSLIGALLGLIGLIKGDIILSPLLATVGLVAGALEARFQWFQKKYFPKQHATR